MKGDQLLDELGWTLPFKPERARGAPLAAAPPGRGGPAVGALPRAPPPEPGPSHRARRRASGAAPRALGASGRVVRRASRPTLVLGSTQPSRSSTTSRRDAAVVGRAPAQRRGRRLVAPGDPVWVDIWVPRGDPLWHDDVGRGPRWVGEWWASALAALGRDDLGCTGVRAVRRAGRRSICFAGVGPGEVVRRAAQGRRGGPVASRRGRALPLLRLPALASPGACAEAPRPGCRRRSAPRALPRPPTGLGDARRRRPRGSRAGPPSSPRLPGGRMGAERAHRGDGAARRRTQDPARPGSARPACRRSHPGRVAAVVLPRLPGPGVSPRHGRRSVAGAIGPTGSRGARGG